MLSIESILQWGGYAVAVVILAVALIRGLRSGNSALKKDSDYIRQQIIDNLEKRNAQLVQENKELKELHERDRKDLQAQITVLGKQVGELSGGNKEKDKLIEAQSKIIENRNPVLEKVLDENLKTNKSIKELLEQIIRQGMAMEKKTDEQTVMIKSQVKREAHIDESTDEGTGNVMRKKEGKNK